MNKLKYGLRKIFKHGLSVLVLAPYYRLCCLAPVKKGLAVLADGHQNIIPYSMLPIEKRLRELPQITVKEFFHDYSFCPPMEGLKIMLQFIPLYASAEYVFICDSFIPSTCAKKRRETTLIQMWHSCGLMKKVGIHSPDDHASMLKTQFRNTDIFTASSAAVSDILSEALMIPREKFSNAGVCRMDLQYDEYRTKTIRERFYKLCPQYRGKKLVFWAPTFRGNARDARLAGTEEIIKLQNNMPEDMVLIIKTHRYAKEKNIDTPVELSSEELLTIADVLITDYSSIYFDFLYYRRPIIMFAPDLENYLHCRGIYPDYLKMPGFHANTAEDLRYALTNLEQWADQNYRNALDELWSQQMDYCDGHSTEKLLRQVGILTDNMEIKSL